MARTPQIRRLTNSTFGVRRGEIFWIFHAPTSRDIPRCEGQRVAVFRLAIGTPETVSGLVGNFSLDKFRQQRQRFLPAEIASLHWYGRGESSLRDVQFGSAEYLFQF